MIRPPWPSSHQRFVLVRSAHGVGAGSGDLMSCSLVLAGGASVVFVTVPSMCPTIVLIVVQPFGALAVGIVLGSSAAASAPFLGRLVSQLGGELFDHCLEFADLLALAIGPIHVVRWRWK